MARLERNSAAGMFVILWLRLVVASRYILGVFTNRVSHFGAVM